MNNLNEIILDQSSGISIEEQKEILTQINGIAEKNKQQLTRNNPAQGIAAGKKGAVFPLAVNIAAVIILAAGAFLLVSFNGLEDEKARSGIAVYNVTERALIDEIRRDTAEKIERKEIEIAEITSRLSEVDNELLGLYSNNQDLTQEQRAAQEILIESQNTFRRELIKLLEERSEILESSRSREARLRTQLDERTREFAAASHKSSAELDTAARELERLTTERDRLAAINALLSGSLAAAGNQMQFNIPNQNDLNNGDSNNIELNDLQERNTALQGIINEMQRTIDSYSTGSVNQDQTISSLRTANTTLEQRVTDRDRTITTLQTDNDTLTSQITNLRNSNASLEQRITDLNNQLTAIRALLSE